VQETAVHHGEDLLARVLDPQRADGEADQQRHVARQDADLALDAARPGADAARAFPGARLRYAVDASALPTAIAQRVVELAADEDALAFLERASTRAPSRWAANRKRFASTSWLIWRSGRSW